MKWTPCLALLFATGACSSSSTSSAADAGGAADSGAPAEAATTATDAGDTWDSWAQGFFATYCVECHSASDSARNYATKADVVRDKLEIRCGVATAQDPSWSCNPTFPPPKQFPIGTGVKPSDAERARAVAWITAGCP